MQNLQNSEWKEALTKNEKGEILDVRTPMEWANGIIDGAIKIDFNDQENFIHFIKKLNASKHYFVYCKSGVRSWYACQMLEQLGLVSFNLKDGISKWDEPLTKP